MDFHFKDHSFSLLDFVFHKILAEYTWANEHNAKNIYIP